MDCFVEDKLVLHEVLVQRLRRIRITARYLLQLASDKTVTGKVLGAPFGHFQELIDLPLVSLRNDRQGVKDALFQVRPVFCVRYGERDKYGKQHHDNPYQRLF